jgi:hypothetical protein
MLRHVAPVRTYDSEELSVYDIGVTRIVELVATSALTSNRRTLRRIRKYYLVFFNYFVFLRSGRQLLVTANVVPSSSILSP